MCTVLLPPGVNPIAVKIIIIIIIRLHRLRWLGHVQRMEENRIPKRVLYMNLESKDQEVDQEIDGKMK
jgi:hypothetical protein